MRRVFLARVTSARLPLVPPNRSRKMRRSCGPDWGLSGYRSQKCSKGVWKSSFFHPLLVVAKRLIQRQAISAWSVSLVGDF